jgi:hypothetical protein
MNHNDHHDTANDGAEGQQNQQQQQRQQQRNDDGAVAILPDYKDQARPFPHMVHSRTVVKTPPKVPTTSSTSPHPKVVPTIPSGRTMYGDVISKEMKKKTPAASGIPTATKNTQAGTLLPPNSPPLPLYHHGPIGRIDLEGGGGGGGGIVSTDSESDTALPLARAVPISRFVDTDSVSHERQQQQEEEEIVDDQLGGHDDNDVVPITSSLHRTVTTKQSQSGDGGANGDSGSTFLVVTLKISRTAFIAIIIVSVLVLLLTIIGVVCGMGHCSSNASREIIMDGSPMSNTIDTPTSSPVADIDIDNTAIAIESYLRIISLTNTSLGGSGNNDDEIIQQADEMAIRWIVNEHVNISINNDDTINTNTTTTIITISDPIVQERLQQLFAIVTMFYSTNDQNSNGLNWTNTTNWLQSQIHECDWYGITCFDEDDTIDQRELDADKNSKKKTITRKYQFAY